MDVLHISSSSAFIVSSGLSGGVKITVLVPCGISVGENLQAWRLKPGAVAKLDKQDWHSSDVEEEAGQPGGGDIAGDGAAAVDREGETCGDEETDGGVACGLERWLADPRDLLVGGQEWLDAGGL